jgi:hypothetical protein
VAGRPVDMLGGVVCNVSIYRGHRRSDGWRRAGDANRTRAAMRARDGEPQFRSLDRLGLARASSLGGAWLRARVVRAVARLLRGYYGLGLVCSLCGAG